MFASGVNKEHCHSRRRFGMRIDYHRLHQYGGEAVNAGRDAAFDQSAEAQGGENKSKVSRLYSKLKLWVWSGLYSGRHIIQW